MSRRPAVLVLLGGLALLPACRGSAAIQRDDEGRRCRLEVVGKPGRYEARVEAGSAVAGDTRVESSVRWRDAGQLLWHPAGPLIRTGPAGEAPRIVRLPGLVGQGDLVRLEVTWLDADGSVTWRRAIETPAP